MAFAEKAKCIKHFVVTYILLYHIVSSQPLIDTSNTETARHALQKLFGYLSADELKIFDLTVPDSFSTVMDMYDPESYIGINGSLPIDLPNGTNWEIIFDTYEMYAKQNCDSLKLESDSCANDCLYYNNVLTWISLIAANDSSSRKLLTRMTGFYSISSGPLAYGDDGNPDMCAFWGGTYCYTPVLIQYYPVWQHACCIPGTCVGEDAIKVLQNNFWCYKAYSERMKVNMDSNITNICEPIPRKLDKFGPSFVIILFFIFLFFVVVASLIYRYFQEAQSVIDNVFISSFNIESLWSSFVGLRSNSSLNFLDGIRVLSMTWVILGHSYLEFWAAGASNILTFNGADILTMMGNGGNNMMPDHSSGFKYLVQRFYTIFLQYAFYSVDSFFFLSGLLATFSIWRKISKYGSSAGRLWYLWMPISYLMRICRIVPMMMYTTAIQWQLSDQIPYGYHVTERHTNTDACNDSWYKILLFYANLTLPPYGGDAHALNCMGHLWYIQIDMQCFIFLPFMLLLFAYNKLYGLLVSLLPTLVCVIIRLYYAFYYHFSASAVSPDITPIHDGNQGNMSYMVPWTRMSVYFTGVSLMFIFLIIDEKYKENKFILPKFHYFVLILLSSFIMLSLVVWPYQDIKDEPEHRWNLLSNQFYYALSRPAWGIALALLTFALKYMNNNKQKSMIKGFLSLDIYQPLGKLTYLMYLLHIPILNIWASDLVLPAYYTGWNELLLICGIWFISAFLSLILWFIMEKPIANLAAAFFKYMQKRCNNKYKRKKHEQLLLKDVFDDEKESGSASLPMGSINQATMVVEE